MRLRTLDNRLIAAPPPDADPAQRTPAPVSLLLRLLVPAENPGGAVYGMLGTGALLAAESGLHDTYLDALASAGLAALLYWLVHAYSGLLGRRLAADERLTPAALGRALARDLAIVRGAALPLCALAIAWAGGASQPAGVSAAVWTAVVGLVVLELLAAVRVRASGRELAVEIAVGVAMGLAVLALRAVVH